MGGEGRMQAHASGAGWVAQLLCALKAIPWVAAGWWAKTAPAAPTPCRVANTILRYMIYTRLSSSLFFFLSLTLLWFAQMGTCASYAETRLGLAPLQVGREVDGGRAYQLPAVVWE